MADQRAGTRGGVYPAPGRRLLRPFRAARRVWRARPWIPVHAGLLARDALPRGADARREEGRLLGAARRTAEWLVEVQDEDGAPVMARAAKIALDEVAAGQVLFTRDPRLYGAIPGSRPVWGNYLSFACPNWARKFFLDALAEGRPQAASEVTGTSAMRPRGDRVREPCPE